MKKLSPGLKLAYASGTITFAVKDVAFISFVMFFYRQVLGVSGSLTGLALLLAMISDSITDPILGSMSDQCRSRWGRRHPFMVVGTLPLAATFLMLFNPMDGLTEFQLFVWLTTAAILLRTALTIFFIPYMALGAELSTDYVERTSVTTYRTTMGWVVALLLYWGCMTFIFGEVTAEDGTVEDGRFMHSRYWILALYSFWMIVGFSAVAIFFTRKRIPFLPKPSEDDHGFGLVRTVVDLKEALGNKNFLVMFFVMLTSSMILGVLPSVALHVNTFFWEFTTKEIGYVGGLFLIPVNLFMFVAMIPLSKRFEKHHLLQFAFIGYGLNLVWFIGLRLLGWLPENGHELLFVLFFVQSMFQTMCMMIIHIISASIIADIVDEQELLTGKRQEGVFFAAQGFSAKAVSGFGTFFGGLVLDFVKMPLDAEPGKVAPEVLFKLGLIVGPILGCFFVIPYLATTRFNVSRARHAEIQQALTERKAQEGSAQEGNAPATDEA